MLKGLDIYSKSDALNFNKVKEDGYSFVICKASEGKTFHDSKFIVNYKSATAAGLIVGAYGFARPSGSTAEDEANTLIDIVESAGGFQLPAILDMEDAGGLTDDQLGQFVTKWRETIQKHDNREPIIYLNIDFYDRLKSYLDGFIIWIAEYEVDNPKMEGWSFWQYTDQGKTEGGTFDIDYFNGDLNELMKLVKQKVQTPPAAPAYQSDNAYHVIQEGETLSGIALHYHVPMNILARYNLIPNPNLIQAGKTLRIPVAYEVRSGDTVSDLARRRKENQNTIGYVNGLQDINKIYIGQTLWV